MSTIYEQQWMDANTVANCDCCDDRPGTHTVTSYGIEMWVCDVCDDDRESEEE